MPELGPCWIWTGAINQAGYGKLRANKKWSSAHRRSYEMHYGSIPDGAFVCHRCDTPSCIRPDHLFAGTAAQNTGDMFQKRRAACQGALGEQNSHHKLTDDQVLTIRARFHRGELIRHLAAEYGLTVGSISNIVNGRTWKHIGGHIRPAGQIGRRARRAA
ncbi:HNH endonuclease [Streptomyces sp. NEAU-H3]|nr:HNH endonuclease [Streptomyces sp. NEAU-H3]